MLQRKVIKFLFLNGHILFVSLLKWIFNTMNKNSPRNCNERKRVKNKLMYKVLPREHDSITNLILTS